MIGKELATTGAELSWTTKDGRVIPLAQMSDEHLVNTKYFLKRQVENLMRSYPNFQGDQAQFCAEADWDNRLNGFQSAIKMMEDEIKKRGLAA